MISRDGLGDAIDRDRDYAVCWGSESGMLSGDYSQGEWRLA
jgi:hypothetical protein